MMANVQMDDLADVIMQELQVYSEEVTEQIKKDVKAVAKECAKEIKNNSPKDTGEYASGWKSKIVYESQNDIRAVVYNAKKPSITHLAEYGYAKVNGGRVPGKAHIRPAEINAEKELLGKVKVAVR